MRCRGKNMKNINSISLLLILLILISISCNTTEPPSNTTLTLKLEDVSCTEAWITLTTANIQLPAAIMLKQTNQTGGTKTKIINLNTQDSLLYIDSLLPNQTYKFHTTIQSSNQSEVKSNEITVATMDTTSHNFTFETFTFGGTAGSSSLYDVAIINENNIWAVGEIKIADASINGYTTYNAVHWNGSDWELKRINMQSSCNPVTYPPLKAIWAFSENNIAVTSGGSIGWFDGNTNRADCGIRSILTGSINKLWGSSSSDLYAVGNNGNIAHYNGQSWIKIESGTTLGLSDIYENKNGELYACGGNLSTGQGIVLKINSNNTIRKIIDSYYYGSGFESTKMFTENLYGPLVGIWAAENGTVYTVGNLIYRYNKGRWDYAKGIEYNYLDAGGLTGRGFSWEIAGIENNDFIFVGERNTVRYFNGIRAVQIGEPFSYTSEYQWYSVDYKQNTAVTAGKKGGYAAVIIFKR